MSAGALYSRFIDSAAPCLIKPPEAFSCNWYIMGNLSMKVIDSFDPPNIGLLLVLAGRMGLVDILPIIFDGKK